MSVTFAAGVNSSLQLAVEPEMRGRVMALYSVVFLGSTPVGGPMVGWLSEAAGPRAGLVLGGLAAIAAGIVARRAFARSAVVRTPAALAVPAVRELVDGGVEVLVPSGAPSPRGASPAVHGRAGGVRVPARRSGGSCATASSNATSPC
jgi:MFS family permease